MDDTIKALTAFVAALGGLVPAVILLWKKVGRQSREIQEIHRQHMLRGKVEALTNNLAVEWFDVSPGSHDAEMEFMPLALRTRVHAMYEPIAVQLRGVRERNPDATEDEMGKLIERRFGGWLAKNVCIKLGVYQYACIAMAVSVADGIPPVPESRHD